MTPKPGSGKLTIKTRAIEAIVSALESVEEKDRADVVNFSLTHVGLVSPINSSATGTEIAATALGSGAGGKGDVAGQTIEDFHGGKKPADQFQQVAVLAFFLKHSESKEEVTNKELGQANIKAGGRRIGNLADVVYKAERVHGFLARGIAKKSHRLTTLGSSVVRALPDQEQVAKAITEHKGGRRPTRKPKRG